MTNNLTYGAITPLASYAMAVLGAALGLRCTIRSLRSQQSWKPGWLALGALSIGVGIWTMHFIAMTGFSIDGAPITYSVPLTVLSLAVAIVMVGVGVFLVGYRGTSPRNLITAGTVTGLGVAAMHYLGMAGIRMDGHLSYSPLVVALSVVVAIVAATAALWAAVSVRGFLSSLGASLVMGIAVTGMHYTGMAAIHVHLSSEAGRALGPSPTSLLLPMLVGPLVFLLLAAVIVMFDPLMVLGDYGEGTARAAAATQPAEENEASAA